MPPSKRTSRLHPAWRSYRHWRRLRVAGFLGYVPAMWLVARASSSLTSSDTPVLVAAMTWMIAWSLCIVRVGWFRCPRCGKAFHLKPRLGPIPLWSTRCFSRHCVNCGLPKWADPVAE